MYHGHGRNFAGAYDGTGLVSASLACCCLAQGDVVPADLARAVVDSLSCYSGQRHSTACLRCEQKQGWMELLWETRWLPAQKSLGSKVGDCFGYPSPCWRQLADTC